MINTLVALVILLLAPSPHHRFGLTEPMPRLDGTIRVASYNMLNFFDQADDPSLQGDYDDFGDNPGPTTNERCEELARIIQSVDADVLALQEIESEEALAWFRDNYLADMGYDYIASKDVGYYRGIEQSLLSRFPITEVKTWPTANLTKVKRTGGGWDEIPAGTREIRFQRSPLCATIETPGGYQVTLFIVHHKSGYNRWHREAEALQIMEYVAAMSQRDPERNIMIVGDFNAQPWDRSMQVYFRGGMVDAMTLRSHNMQHDDASPLRTTHTSGRLIDFMLLNHAAVGEMVNGSGFVLGTSAEEYDWKNNPIPPGYASDHYPLVIDLVPREGQGSTVTATPWPRSAMAKALSASPIKRSTPSKSASRSSGSSGKKSNDAADPGGYAGSSRSQVFHKASCGNAKKISDKNRVKYDSIADAEKAGKRPAGCCKPGS
ncbi:MAG: endonuclease/exonuclease/phosphatase family protein [Planctomycetota bacterium]|nr:endonuclease/exonuclease/phosphatase family protein [Planctomycetota bacterium]